MKINPSQSTHPIYPTGTCSYILRIWRDEASKIADWRASLEIPETGKRIGFASLEQLFAFLIEISESSLLPPTNIESGLICDELDHIKNT